MCGTLTGPYLRVHPPPIGPGALSPLGQVHRDTQTASPPPFWGGLGHRGIVHAKRPQSVSIWICLSGRGSPVAAESGSVESPSSGKKPFIVWV